MRTIVTICAQLADWHGQALKGVHHDGEKIASAAVRDPSWVRAETALAEAARCRADAAKAVRKAKKANDQALWFDEVFEDEG